MGKKKAIFLLLALATQGYAEVYKWTDRQGVVHFSDYPHEGSQPVVNTEVQSFSSPAPKSASSEPLNSEPNRDKAEQVDYKVFITQPIAEATIRNNQGDVAVTVEVEPNLAKENSIQLLYDGSPTGEPQKGLMFQISGIYRGKHTLAVQILDREGQILSTSEPINIYMQRPRVGMVHKNGS